MQASATQQDCVRASERPESLAELQPGSLKHAGTNATVRFGSLFQWDFFAAQVSRLPLH
jgi:hypothetical protein